MRVGTRVRSLREFVGVPKGTEGVVDEDYGDGVMVAWDLPDRPLPAGYVKWDGRLAIAPGAPLRDGFGKEFEMQWLETVPPRDPLRGGVFTSADSRLAELERELGEVRAELRRAKSALQRIGEDVLPAGTRYDDMGL